MAGQPLLVPIAVFLWQVFGAAVTFRRGPGSRASPLIEVISIGFFVLIAVPPVRVNPLLPVVGSIGALGALVLFEWTRWTVRGRHFGYIFGDETPEFLCTQGPYGHIRNPFYTSYLMNMGSVVVISPGAIRLAVFAGFVVYFTAAAMQEERAFARSHLADEYARYRARTGRFLPKWMAAGL